MSAINNVGEQVLDIIKYLPASSLDNIADALKDGKQLSKAEYSKLKKLYEAARKNLDDIVEIPFKYADEVISSIIKTSDDYLKYFKESPKGLIGIDFEKYLTDAFQGVGSFKVSGREFDGALGKVWWEAKSGEYWSILNDSNALAKFKSDMGHRFKIAKDNGATYELFSNTPIPDNVKQWLVKKGIPFT